jgi:hypothetical protein
MGRNNKDFQTSALFHGTSHPFNDGDIVEPRLIDPNDSYSRASEAKAWASPDADSAFRFGSRKLGRAANVFQVEPLEDGETKFLNNDPTSGQVYSRKGFRVVKKVR